AIARVAAGTVLCLVPLGVAREWRYPAFADLNFPAYCRRYSALGPGQEIDIPINPPGWSMRLQKQADGPAQRLQAGVALTILTQCLTQIEVVRRDSICDGT